MAASQRNSEIEQQLVDAERRRQQRHFVDELLERQQVSGMYGVVEIHIQAGEIVRTKTSRTEELPRRGAKST